MLKDGAYEMITDEVINKVYLKRCGKKLKEYYTEEFRTIRTPVYEINKPIFYENKINLCPQLPSHTPYNDFPKHIKDKCQIFLNYMFDVLANKREDVFLHLKKWISNMCKGEKNDSALVLKTLAKGVGKSTLPQMLAKHILGPKLCLETGSEPLKSRFNHILGGKLLVSFEELETFSTAEWSAVESVLKRQITSDSIVLQAKGQDAFTTKNINNYILLSNHDLYDSDRRMFVLDVQTHYKGNREYWSNIYNNCFNNDVGNALYSYFYEIDTNNYHPQDYPLTENKLNSISKRLDFVYQYLKEEHILSNKDLKSKLSDLYDEFTFWCTKNKKKSLSKN
jgi:phage/plasmid-associated DNA primase